MIMFVKIFLILILNLSDFEGKVVGVIDGATIEVLKGGKGVRIRLNGIDCPERTQDYGTKAKQYVSALIFQHNVKVKVKELDRYGRTIADIYLTDGTWLNKKLIDEGLAWHYKQYSSNKELSNGELKARRDRRSLWQVKNPVAPWEFRKSKRTN
jgi:micrococcal nuclease